MMQVSNPQSRCSQTVGAKTADLTLEIDHKCAVMMEFRPDMRFNLLPISIKLTLRYLMSLQGN